MADKAMVPVWIDRNYGIRDVIFVEAGTDLSYLKLSGLRFPIIRARQDEEGRIILENRDGIKFS